MFESDKTHQNHIECFRELLRKRFRHCMCFHCFCFLVQGERFCDRHDVMVQLIAPKRFGTADHGLCF